MLLSKAIQSLEILSLIFTFSFIASVNQTKAEEINQFSSQNTVNLDSFNLKSTSVEEKELFFQNFAEQKSLSQTENFTFAQSNPNEDELDFGEPIDDNQIFWFLLFDQLEYQVNEHQNIFNWDAIAWVGGDYQKLWIKSEGDVNIDDGDGETELQLLYGRLIAPYWDFQVGLRYDQLYGESAKGRGFAVIGVEGLAPYFFEVDAAMFVSHQGDVSARFKAEYELLLSQRLVLQPVAETNLAIQEVEEFGVGSGFNDLELGLRLRYEINREFAPYIGVSWTKLFGDTAKFAQEEGESSDDLKFVAGVRLMF